MTLNPDLFTYYSYASCSNIKSKKFFFQKILQQSQEIKSTFFIPQFNTKPTAVFLGKRIDFILESPHSRAGVAGWRYPFATVGNVRHAAFLCGKVRQSFTRVHQRTS